MVDLKSAISNPFMHGWQRITVLTFLDIWNFWTFILLFQPYRGSNLYIPCIHGLHPSALPNEIGLLIKKIMHNFFF